MSIMSKIKDLSTKKSYVRSEVFPEVCYEFEPLSRQQVVVAYKNRKTITGIVEDMILENEELIVKLGNELYGILPFNEVTIYDFVYSEKHETLPVQIYNLINQKVRVKVKSIDDEIIMLSRKQNMYDAFNYLTNCEFTQMYITSMRPNVAFGDIGDGIIGRLTVKETSTARIRNVCELFHKGSILWVKCLDTESQNVLSVSYKQTFPTYNPNDFSPGDVLTGKVCGSIDDRGTGYFIAISPQISGILDVKKDVPVLQYGHKIQCYVKRADERGLKLDFFKILD